MSPVTERSVDTLARCLAVGGVALFPTDTVYGLATEPESREGVERLYALKGRPPDRPAAVMFFSLELALESLAEIGPDTRLAVETLLPGPLTLLVPNPARRFPLACGPVPERLGVRVPSLPEELAALEAMRWPLLQSSANRSGGADPRRLLDVDREIRDGVDLQIDGGELAGTPSTVVDLTGYEGEGDFGVLREGAMSAAEVGARLP